jgi:hypothetical protein
MLDIGGERGSLVLVNGLREQKRVFLDKHLKVIQVLF